MDSISQPNKSNRNNNWTLSWCLFPALIELIDNSLTALLKHLNHHHHLVLSYTGNTLKQFFFNVLFTCWESNQFPSFSLSLFFCFFCFFCLSENGSMLSLYNTKAKLKLYKKSVSALPAIPVLALGAGQLQYCNSQNIKCDSQSLKQLCRENHQDLLPLDRQSLMWAKHCLQIGFYVGGEGVKLLLPAEQGKNRVVPYANPLRHE